MGLIVSMWVGNVLLVVLNLPLIGLWVRMLRVPYGVLFPAIIAFSAVGCYSLALNAYDVLAVALFGVLGYFLIRMGCEPAPLLLGFVLGPLLEENLRRALIISRGDPSVFLTRPISLALLVLAAAASSWQRSPRSAGSARSSSRRKTISVQRANHRKGEAPRLMGRARSTLPRPESLGHAQQPRRLSVP